jgi:hypothetical protein
MHDGQERLGVLLARQEELDDWNPSGDTEYLKKQPKQLEEKQQPLKANFGDLEVCKCIRLCFMRANTE